MSGPPWQLRRASESDLAAIMALETSTFTTDAWSPQSMRRELAGEHTYYLVAFPPESPDRVDAYAGLLAPPAGQGDIQTIAVAPNARRHGLGRTLVRSLLAEARKRAVREVFLEVRADNPGAQQLYRSLGFEEIDIRRGYYQPDAVDAIVMRVTVDEPRTILAEPVSGSEAEQ